jgi:hypothetical protein
MYDDLGFDYEELNGHTVVGISGSGFFIYNDGGISFDSIQFELDNCRLLISADPDTDEVNCSVIDKNANTEGMQEVLQMNAYVGSELGWIWLAKNYLGYRDMVAISFDGIDPDIAMIGVASKLNLCRFERLKA